MNLPDIIHSLKLALPSLSEIPTIVVFLISLLLSLLIGRYTPAIVGLLLQRFAPPAATDTYETLVQPIRDSLRLAGVFILIALSLVWLKSDYPALHNFLSPFINLGVIVSVAWLTSRLFRQFLRSYGIELLRRLGREADELLLVAETLANVSIGFVATLAFAQSQQFNLIGLLASLSIGGLAVAFAAQKILEQLISTIVLYLDKPFVPGDYIRVSLHSGNVYGRVESIGLRSTKLRTSAKSTLMIIPNSMLANLDIENVTRGKKVMVMLYLDFPQPLNEQDTALVKQVITHSTESLFGIDPGSTNIAMSSQQNNSDNHQDKISHRARVTFFILGSKEDSIQLRKHLLEMANKKITKELSSYGIKFTVQEPTIYVESPVTL